MGKWMEGMGCGWWDGMRGGMGSRLSLRRRWISQNLPLNLAAANRPPRPFRPCFLVFYGGKYLKKTNELPHTSAAALHNYLFSFGCSYGLSAQKNSKELEYSEKEQACQLCL